MSIDLSREGKQKIQQAVMRKGFEFASVWKKNVPVYTGRYRQSISVEPVGDIAAMVGTNVEYAKRIEFGLGEGTWPDIDGLREWVDRVISPDPDRLDSVTFLVARKIFFEGVNEQAPFRRSLREFKSNQ